MKYQNFSDHFQTLMNLALQMKQASMAQALLVLVEGPLDWVKLKEQAGSGLLAAVETPEQDRGAKDAGIASVRLKMPDSPVHERISQAVLQCVADDVLKPGSRVVAVYSGFEADTIDSLSLINLGEHLERLTSSDLRALETDVPLDTLKLVVDLAVEIGTEGREGKAVGTMFVVGDHRKVLQYSRPTGFDLLKGYNRRERDLHDRRVREGIKELAQLDGAFVVSSRGIVEASCRYIDAPAEGLTLAKGLGTRHWSAAAISRACKAIAICVSQSSGSVRIFKTGEPILRVEPLRRRAMKWKDFDFEPRGRSD